MTTLRWACVGALAVAGLATTGCAASNEGSDGDKTSAASEAEAVAHEYTCPSYKGTVVGVHATMYRSKTHTCSVAHRMAVGWYNQSGDWRHGNTRGYDFSVGSWTCNAYDPSTPGNNAKYTSVVCWSGRGKDLRFKSRNGG